MHTITFPVDRYGVPSYDELVLVANRDRLGSDAGYRSAVRRFVAGLAAGTAWARAHPAEAVDVMERTPQATTRTSSTAACPPRFGCSTPPRSTLSAWTAFGDWMHGRGLLEQPPDGAALVASP